MEALFSWQKGRSETISLFEKPAAAEDILWVKREEEHDWSMNPCIRTQSPGQQRGDRVLLQVNRLLECYLLIELLPRRSIRIKGTERREELKLERVMSRDEEASDRRN